jgi:hypothetical protein
MHSIQCPAVQASPLRRLPRARSWLLPLSLKHCCGRQAGSLSWQVSGEQGQQAGRCVVLIRAHQSASERVPAGGRGVEIQAINYSTLTILVRMS